MEVKKCFDELLTEFVVSSVEKGYTMKEIWTAMRNYMRDCPVEEDVPEVVVEDTAIVVGGEAVGIDFRGLGKKLFFSDIKECADWDSAVEYAKSIGKALPTKEELKEVMKWVKYYEKYLNSENVWWIAGSSTEDSPKNFVWCMYKNGVYLSPSKKNKMIAFPLTEVLENKK